MERCCILSSAHAHPSYIHIGRKEFLNKTYLDIIEIKDKLALRTSEAAAGVKREDSHCWVTCNL